MGDLELLNRVSSRAGIEPFYWDISGVQHFAAAETKWALLHALGAISRIGDEEELRRLDATFDAAEYLETIPPVIVVRCGTGERWRCPLHLEERESHFTIRWSLRGESCASESQAGESLAGGSQRGEAQRGVAEVLSGTEDLSAVRAVARASVAGRPMVRYELWLPFPAEPGYYRFSVFVSDGEREQEFATELIAAPHRCHLAGEHERRFGVSLQLPLLRSTEQLGCGDFSDLLDAIPQLASAGADAVGLNPLHSLFEHNGDEVSPYAPSSRLSRNVLLLSHRLLPEWSDDAQTQAFVRGPSVQDRLRRLSGTPQVDFAEVYRLKWEVFQRLWRHFRAAHLEPLNEAGEAFHRWRANAPSGMIVAAQFSALREWLLGLSPSNWGWPVWPAEYQRPESPAVRRFCEEHASEIDFYLWLQWRLEQQLARVQQECLESGMTYGLYLDLALGAGNGGAETWANQSVYSFSAGAGAPPDELGPQGQAWGLPPYRPKALREACYRPFREAVSSAMQHAGALRIDHIMSLCRLFWIPNGLSAKDGGYVRYPLSDLMGIVALESIRHRCTVIGEDLGTVPDEVRAAMASYGVLSYKVLYFMTEGERAAPPDHYPACSLVVTSTHDLPTLWSFWDGRDIALREDLGLFDTPEIGARVRELREAARRMICEALQTEGLRAGGAGIPQRLDWALCEAIHRYLARAGSQLQMVQAEDLLQLTTQVNVPGTTAEHPNWRFRLPVTLLQMLERPEVRELLRKVASERGATPGSG